MIRLDTKDGARHATVWSEPPIIYMDNWALVRFSADPVLRTEFLGVFRDRGTLAVSLMSVAEIGAHRAQQRPELRSFLEAIGPRWVPLTIDPFSVMNTQEGSGSRQSACLSSAFLNDPHFSSKLLAGDLSLVHIVDLTRGGSGALLKASSDRSTHDLCECINALRSHSDPQALEQAWPQMSFNAKASMRPIYNAFVRLSLKDSFKWTANHARDLYHAITSMGCADMTVLDPHWANQARKVQKLIGMPLDFVRVYSKHDLSRFLADLAAFPPSRDLFDPGKLADVPQAACG
jgi:hypothetical protein